MTVEVVGTPAGAINFTAGTGLSYSVEPGAERLLLLAAGAEAGGQRTISSVTFDAVAANDSLLKSSYNGTAIHAVLAYWNEAAIASMGAMPNDFSLTYSIAPTNSDGVALTISGVDQTTPIAAAVGQDHVSSTSWPLTGQLAADGDLAIIVACTQTAFRDILCSGYTKVSIATSNFTGAVFYKRIVATGTEAPTVTFDNVSSGSTYFVIIGVAGGLFAELVVTGSAVGEGNVAGAVFEYSDGVTGAKIGEFTGGSFVAGSGATAGLAVMRIPVADFGGSALVADDPLIIIAENATFTTGAADAVVVGT